MSRAPNCATNRLFQIINAKNNHAKRKNKPHQKQPIHRHAGADI